MITKNIKKILVAGVACCGFAMAMTSCEDFFETDSDRQIFDPELNAKTDSMFYTLGILKGLQQVADQYVLTGEMRGDLVTTNSYTETALRQLADFSADASNKYDSAYLYYRVINNCNYYVAHRDTSLRTGSRQVALQEYAEALAVRAWAYMQLCKTYGEVPFYTDPLTSIGQANSNIPTKNLQGVCDALAPELIKFSGTIVPTYGNIEAGVLNGVNSSETKTIQSAKAMLPVDVVLGDLYLETHQYAKAAQYYFNYILTNKLVMHQAYIYPDNFSVLRQDYPRDADVTLNKNDNDIFQWSRVFNISNPADIVTYIPMAANKLRGVTTELPLYFGYDFYSTTSGSSDRSARYLLERQIDPSATYLSLNRQQGWYYEPSSSSGSSTVIKTLTIGDMRRYETLQDVKKQDSTFTVMTKFISANVPLYRAATVYLRLAEAINRMGYPDVAFAILKDGINEDLSTYVQKGDSTDLLVTGRYIRPESYQLLCTTVPFCSDENIALFEDNWGIHSRGTNYTMGSFSPYQLSTVVGQKISEMTARDGFVAKGNLNDTIMAVEDLLCDEMALELAFEGSRFGDLTRIALHRNNTADPINVYGANYGSRWLSKKLAYKNPTKDLTDEKNWYLPFK